MSREGQETFIKLFKNGLKGGYIGLSATPDKLYRSLSKVDELHVKVYDLHWFIVSKGKILFGRFEEYHYVRV